MDLSRMPANEKVVKAYTNTMGKIRGCSLDSDYIFMEPSSAPAIKCAKACFDPNFIERRDCKDEQDHILPNSDPTPEDIPIKSSLFNMIDMSELYAPREEPVVTREIVTPPKQPERSSCSYLRQNRLNSNHANQKFIFPANETENSKAKNLSPTTTAQRRALRMVKSSKSCSALLPQGSSDTYMEMGRYCAVNYMNQQPKQQNPNCTHTNSSTEIFNKSYSMFISNNEETTPDDCCSKSSSECIYADVVDYENCFEDCDREQCNSIGSYQSGGSSPVSVQSHNYTCNALAQRRLPPRPKPENQMHDAISSGRTPLDGSNCIQRRSSIPENPPPLPPTCRNVRSSSPVTIRSHTSTIPKQDSQTSSTSQSQTSGSPTSKLSTLKSKTSALFNKNLLSKSNLFSKIQKQKSHECETSCDEYQKKSESSSPKPFRKIHPIAEMIKKRKNAIQAGIFSGSSSNASKANQTEETKSTPKTTSVEAKKPLTSTQSFPQLCTKTASPLPPPTKHKALTAMKSSPELVANHQSKTMRSNTEGNVLVSKMALKPKTPPARKRTEVAPGNSHNQSFLYRRGSDIRFDDNSPKDKPRKAAPQPPIKPNVGRSRTFDGLSADSFIAESYEVPLFLQNYSNVDDSPSVTNSIESDVFTFSPKPKLSPRVSTESYSSNSSLNKQRQSSPSSPVEEKQSQFEKLRSNFTKAATASQYPSLDANGAEPNRNSTFPKAKSHRVATRSVSATLTESSNSEKEKDNSVRPPPPSLQKIREARLRKNWSSQENRDYNENLLSSNTNRIPASEARQRFIDRSKHLSNPELPPSPEEDIQYSIIPESTQNLTNTGNKLKLSRNKSLGAAASCTRSIKSRMGRPNLPQPVGLKTGGSVESFESDSSLKDDADSESIYEDIIDNFFPNYNTQTS